MNAYELADAAFDPACDFSEETIQYIVGYAAGAFDAHVSDEVAQKILDCRRECREATERNGDGQCNAWHFVRVPLEQIEL